MHLPAARSAGLTAQLQALRKALYHKYLQEVAALKEEHSRELKRLREEREPEWKREEHQTKRGETEQDLNSINGAGGSIGSLGAAGQAVLGGRQDWERVEEEVAKVGDLLFLLLYNSCVKSVSAKWEQKEHSWS